MLGKWQEKSSGFRLVSGWTSLVTVEGPLPETGTCAWKAGWGLLRDCRDGEGV